MVLPCAKDGPAQSVPAQICRGRLSRGGVPLLEASQGHSPPKGRGEGTYDARPLVQPDPRRRPLTGSTIS